MSGIQGSVVALTGGGSGLGLGLVRYFVKEGAKLAVLDVSEEKVAALRAELGDGALVAQGDVCDVGALQAFHDATVAKFGGVDSLIGVQGIWDGYRKLMTLQVEQLRAAFDEVMHINVLGFILSARVFHDSLAARRGAIVFTGSSNSSYAADGGGVFYTASKHAVAGVVRQLAFEFAPTVRVNGVAPFAIRHSDMRNPKALGAGHESQADFPKDGFLQTVKDLTLLDHMPTGEEYGPVFALLAMPRTSVMTGSMVAADQGLLNRAVVHRATLVP